MKKLGYGPDKRMNIKVTTRDESAGAKIPH
jgi:hypothetical protein